jgi:hypothetical protein
MKGLVSDLVSESIDEEAVGNELCVRFTLPVCRICEASGGSPKMQKSAQLYMMKVPLYRELIEYYPQLTLHIEQQP